MDGRSDLPKGSSGSPTPPEDGWNVPLIHNGKVIEQPAIQSTLTKRYTEHAVKFIREKKGSPFFLYFAHTFPHVPLFASADFKGKSRAGIFGDAVEELDWSVGEVLKTLRGEGLAENTLVVFSSDNGPWLVMNNQGGSAGLLRDGKGSTWEGGMRVPGIAWMPGKIKPAVTTQMASVLDLYPTALTLAGAESPTGVTLDGTDLSPVLFEAKSLAERPFFYYRGNDIFACRIGEWKAHYQTQSGYGQPRPDVHATPQLYHLGVDPSEKRNVAAAHPEVVAKFQAAFEQQKLAVQPGAPQLQ